MVKINSLLVCGSRAIHDEKWIRGILCKYTFKTLIVGTDAKRIKQKPQNKWGIDEWAFKYAKENKIKIISLVPDWESFAIKAGIIRNSDMVAQLHETDDWGIALWDGKSPGTNDTITKLRKCKKLFAVHLYKIQPIEAFPMFGRKK